MNICLNNNIVKSMGMKIFYQSLIAHVYNFFTYINFCFALLLRASAHYETIIVKTSIFISVSNDYLKYCNLNQIL